MLILHKSTENKFTFSHGKIKTINLELSDPSRQDFVLSNIIDEFINPLGVLNFLIPKSEGLSDTNSQLLNNIRGRPFEAFAYDPGGFKPGERSEELVFLGGSIFDLPTSLVEYEKISFSDLSSSTFSYSLHSVFSDIPNSKTIRHSLKQKVTSAFPEFDKIVNLKQIRSLIPIAFKTFRIGIEVYNSHFFGSMLGFAPTIAERFYLDCSEDKILLHGELQAERDISKVNISLVTKLLSVLSSSINPSKEITELLSTSQVK